MAIEETLSAEGFSPSILLQKMPNKAYGCGIGIKHGSAKFVGVLTLQVSYDEGRTFVPAKTYTGPQSECMQAYREALVRIGFAENDYISGEAVIHLSTVGNPRRKRVRSMV